VRAAILPVYQALHGPKCFDDLHQAQDYWDLSEKITDGQRQASRLLDHDSRARCA
jgi:hypothetical protein